MSVLLDELTPRRGAGLLNFALSGISIRKAYANEQDYMRLGFGASAGRKPGEQRAGLFSEAGPVVIPRRQLELVTRAELHLERDGQGRR
jgi:hypothetical protein